MLSAMVSTTVFLRVSAMCVNYKKTACVLLFALLLAPLLISCSQIRQYALWGSTSSENGVYKIGNPYQVMGTWYYPKEDYDYSEVGVASWYGPDFHNGVTANGEIYDMHLMTAAHRTLPLPSIVRVTNLENGRSVVLRVNDRGPFVNNRIIDVSKLAAERLGFIEKGTTRVRVDILADESRELKEAMLAGDIAAQTAYTKEGRTPHKKQPVRSMTAPQRPADTYMAGAEAEQDVAPIRSITRTPVTVSDEMDDIAANPEERIVSASLLASETSPLLTSEASPLSGSADKASDDKSVEADTSGSGLYVQVGAFSNKQNAEKFAGTLAKYGSTKITATKINGADVYRVRMGAFASGKDALEALDKMRALGYNDARIVEEVVLKKGW